MKLNIVPPGTGKLWVRLGVHTFLRQPLAMSGLLFLSMAIASILGIIPYLGAILYFLPVPALSLGLMAAARVAADGAFPGPSVLFTAFRAGPENTRSMLLLGAIYAGAVLLIGAVVALVDGGEFAKSQQALESINDLMKQPPEVQEAAVPAILSHLTRLMSHTLLTLVLYTPVSMAFWHAPALTHWHGVSVVKSLFFSFIACIRNFKQMAAFSLYWAALCFAVTLPLYFLGMLLGSLELAMGLLAPASLLLMAMFSTSVYFSFRDTFAEDPSESDQTLESQEQP